MLQTRGRKIWRDVTTRKARTALVAISIFIGVLGVVALSSMGEIFVSRLREDIDQDKLAMARTYVTLDLAENLDNAAIMQALQDLPQVEAAQGMSIYASYWRKPGEPTFKEARMFAYSTPLDQVALEPPHLVEGRLPVTGQNELAVERRLAADYDLALGDTIEVRILSTDSSDIVTETWTVVGTLYMGYQYPIAPGAPNLVMGNTILFANYADAQHIAGFGGFNLIQVRYADYAQVDLNQVESTLSEQSPYTPVSSSKEDPALNAFIVQVESFSGVLALISIVALLVSGFLVFNVINAIVVEQRRQIGVMKSLGASGWDNFSIYAGIALVYGLLGVIPGVILGVPAGFYAAKALAPQFNIFVDEFVYSTNAILLGLIVGLLIPVFSALIPVIMGIRVRIIEAMTDLGISSAFGQGPLARLTSRLPLPISLQQALRNVVQKKFRLLLTITTLAVAAGAFMGVYAMLASLNTMTANIFNTFGNDLSISPTELQDYDTLAGQLAGVEGIRNISPATIISTEIIGFEPQQVGGQSATVLTYGFDTTNPEAIVFDLAEGTAWVDDPERRGVVLSKGIAEALDKHAGDTVEVRAGNKTDTYEILGISNYPFDTIWFRWQDLSELGGLVEGAPQANQYFTTLTVGEEAIAAAGLDDMGANFLNFEEGAYAADGVSISTALAADYQIGDTLSLTAGENTISLPITGIFEIPAGMGTPDTRSVALDWQALAALEGKTLTGTPQANILAIMLDQADPSAVEVDETIEQVNRVLLDQGVSANYTNWIETQEYVSQLIVTSGVIMNTAAFLIAAVGAIGLLSTLSISVFERQKEIGVMRSVGATSSTVATQFLVEGLIVGLIAWLIGVPLGYGLNEQLMTALNFGDAAGATGYPLSTIVVGLIGMLGIVIIASLWPSLAAARKTVSDILRYQ